MQSSHVQSGSTTSESAPSVSHVSDSLLRIGRTAEDRVDHYLHEHLHGDSKTLYDGQWQVFQSLRQFLHDGGTRGYVRLPTRVGKSVIIAELVEALGLPCAVLTNRSLLQEDISEAISMFADGVTCAHLRDPLPDSDRAHAAVATYSYLTTAGNRGESPLQQYPVIILDEGHEIMGPERLKLIREYYANHLIFAFTATPTYSEEKSLKVHLGPEIHSMSIREAVEMGLICEFMVITAETDIDISSVSSFGSGELSQYSMRDLAQVLNKAKLNQAAVQLHLERFRGQYEIDFCSGVDHAQELAKLFNASGVPAESLTSADSKKSQREKKAAFQHRELEVLTNDSMLKFGVTFPHLTVVQNLVPTLSPVDSEQRSGRPLGLWKGRPDKLAIIVEYLHQDRVRRRQQVTFLDIVNSAFVFRPEKSDLTGSPRFARTIAPIQIEGLQVSVDAEKVMQVHRRRRAALATAEDREYAVDEPASELRKHFSDLSDVLLRLPVAVDLAIKRFTEASRRDRQTEDPDNDSESAYRRRRRSSYAREQEFLAKALPALKDRNTRDFERYAREPGPSARFCRYSLQTAAYFKHLESKLGRELLTQGDRTELWQAYTRATVQLDEIVAPLSRIAASHGLDGNACLRLCPRNGNSVAASLKEYLRDLGRAAATTVLAEAQSAWPKVREWENYHLIRWDAFRDAQLEVSKIEREILGIEHGPIVSLGGEVIDEVVKKYAAQGLDRDELTSRGYEVLLGIARQYETRKNYRFSSFLKEQLERSFRSLSEDEHNRRSAHLLNPEDREASFHFADVDLPPRNLWEDANADVIDPDDALPPLSELELKPSERIEFSRDSIDQERLHYADLVLAELPKEFRAHAIAQFGLDGAEPKTLAEMATKEGLPIGTMKSRQHRLSTRLKKAGDLWPSLRESIERDLEHRRLHTYSAPTACRRTRP